MSAKPIHGNPTTQVNNLPERKPTMATQPDPNDLIGFAIEPNLTLNGIQTRVWVSRRDDRAILSFNGETGAINASFHLTASDCDDLSDLLSRASTDLAISNEMRRTKTHEDVAGVTY